MPGVSSTPPPALSRTLALAERLERRSRRAARQGDYETAYKLRAAAIALIRRVNDSLARGVETRRSIFRDEMLAGFYAKHGKCAAAAGDYETATRLTRLAGGFLDNADADRQRLQRPTRARQRLCGHQQRRIAARRPARSRERHDCTARSSERSGDSGSDSAPNGPDVPAAPGNPQTPLSRLEAKERTCGFPLRRQGEAS